MRAICCAGCAFWSPGEDVSPNHFYTRYGQCRRYPPTLLNRKLDAPQIDRGWLLASWPLTPEGAWCGEFQKKDTDAHS